jgi:hypothetical protein
MIRRFNLELLYHKTMAILHRHHMTKAYTDPKYNFSRAACVEAAMQILTHQGNLRRELRPSGLLHRKRALITSLEQSDFVLASVIVSLELSFRGRGDKSPDPSSDNTGFLNYSRQDLYSALQTSQAYLHDMSDVSNECRYASNVLSVVLHKYSEKNEMQAGTSASNATTTASLSDTQFDEGNYGAYSYPIDETYYWPRQQQTYVY